MLLHNIANVIFTDLYINSLVPNIKYICIQQNNNSDLFAIVESTSPVFGIIIVIVYAFLCLLFFFLQLCKYFKQTRKREREKKRRERKGRERE